MPSTPKQALRIQPASAGPVSRARKRFNTLIKKLEGARALLAEWKDTLPAVSSKAEADYFPLQDAWAERLRHLVVLLDGMHGHKLLGKREKVKLSTFLSHMSLELLEGGDDPEIKAIYNRHSGGDFDADEADSKERIRDLLEEMLGAEFKGEIDVRSPEAIMQAFEAQMQEQLGHTARDLPPETPSRPKRPAELARERREAAEAERVQQSLREIFRKLASQLHPDREPDEAERLRKTALMQRVNVAYAAKDMLALLELQLEVEQIDQASLAGMSDERIKQYNKVLEEQLRELEMELASVEEVAAMQMDADMFDVVTPLAMRRALDDDIGHLQIKLAIIDDDLKTLGDVKLLKAWLKEYQPPKPSPASDDDIFW